MALIKTPVCNFDEKAIDFTLLGTDDKVWSLADCAGDNGTLVMFICNHCPYVKAIQLELATKAIQAKEKIAKESSIILLPDGSSNAASLVAESMAIIQKISNNNGSSKDEKETYIGVPPSKRSTKGK